MRRQWVVNLIISPLNSGSRGPSLCVISPVNIIGSQKTKKLEKNWKILAGGLRETVIPMFTVKCLVLKKQGQDLTWLLTGVYDQVSHFFFVPFGYL